MAMEIHASAVNEKKHMQEKLNNLKSNKPNLQDQKVLEQGRCVVQFTVFFITDIYIMDFHILFSYNVLYFVEVNLNIIKS